MGPAHRLDSSRRGLRARLLAGLAVLVAAPAWAHQPNFRFVAPEGLGHVVEGGPVVLQWESSDPLGTGQFELFASRKPVADWRLPTPDEDVRITPAPLPLKDSPRQYSWDTTGLPPGCYQPYAREQEPGEHWYFVVPGKVTVRAPTFVPPAVWIDNKRGDELDASGHFTLRYRVEDPDSETRVTLMYGDGTSLFPLAEGVTFPVGGGEGTLDFDASALENGYYELYARVEAAGEPTCETFWVDVLYVPGGPYPSATDGGTPDGGATDGGPDVAPPDGGPAVTPPDGGPDAGPPGPPPPPRTGCAASPGGWAMPALSLLAARTERLRRRRSLAPQRVRPDDTTPAGR